MLRIESKAHGSNGLELHLEGQVVGPWVVELERICEDALTAGSHLLLDLGNVSFVSREGVALLARLRDGHACLSNCSSFVAEQLKANDVAGGRERSDER